MIKINPEVKAALAAGKPVVALESTIISHGMPYPRNVKTALAVEAIIRENGAIPATIGIIDGVPIVGLTPDEIELFGKTPGIRKVSRRDLAYVIAKKLWGATTVATTMILAAEAGIEVFVTGGIGGVHRGAEKTFDISADLTELGQTNVTVVCAGAKAILNLGLTLEYLETLGVPVYGYQTKKLPAFYSASSKFEVDEQLNTPKEVAEVISVKRKSNLKGGILITNPIPAAYSLDVEEIEKTIQSALKEMEKAGVKGKDSTPFLLAKIAELTKGTSLDSNIALVENNARLGAKIALELCEINKEKR